MNILVNVVAKDFMHTLVIFFDPCFLEVNSRIKERDYFDTVEMGWQIAPSADAVNIH